MTPGEAEAHEDDNVTAQDYARLEKASPSEKTEIFLQLLERAEKRGELDLSAIGDRCADLSHLDLSPETLKARLQHSRATPPWSWDESLGRARLRVNLQGANLSYANLRNADLIGADLRGAVLSYATIQGADLREAVLQDARLEHANLRGTDLSGDTKLGGAFLQGADLREACLPSVDWSPSNPGVHRQ